MQTRAQQRAWWANRTPEQKAREAAKRKARAQRNRADVNLYHKGWRARNPEKVAAFQRKTQARPEYKARSRITVRTRRTALRSMVNDLKARPCADCGRTYPPCAMDFDHRGADKTAIVARMVGSGSSRQRVLAEIAKCDLVCATCHRIRTFTRGQHLRPRAVA